MSSTSPSRPMGVSRTICDSISAFSTVCSASVRVEPTAMAFTRIFGANSCASSRVSMLSAPLAVP